MLYLEMPTLACLFTKGMVDKAKGWKQSICCLELRGLVYVQENGQW